MKLLPGASSIILRSTPCSNWVKEQNHALIVKWAPQLLKYKNLKALLIQGNLSTLVLKSNQQVRNQESILGKNWNMSSLLKPSFFWGCELWTCFVSGTPLRKLTNPPNHHDSAPSRMQFSTVRRKLGVESLMMPKPVSWPNPKWYVPGPQIQRTMYY